MKKTTLAAFAAGLLGSLSFSADAAPAPSTQPAASAASTAKVTSLYGNITPFYGNISAFWGNISPFWGNISPFWGNISPFYGNVTAFWGNITPFSGNVSAFYGNITPFTGDVAAHAANIGNYWTATGASWNSLDASWASAAGDVTKLAAVGASLNSMIAQGAAFWGNAVQTKTGKSFSDGFAAPLFAKYGIDPNDPSTLAGKTAAQRAEFMMAWYDQLNEYSGFDHVDHWMKEVNWTPAITVQQGDGAGAVIGLIDFTIAGDVDVQSNLSYFSGKSTFSNGHGAGVASLMVAARDGQGVMGIAPNAKVVAYNPFDATGTTDFSSVKAGIIALSGKGAGVINMSLGVPGWTLAPDWKGVFADPTVAAMRKNTIFVTAAGNDGLAQTTNIAWNQKNDTDPNLIVVGSVDPNGKISSFSNTPGTACLLKSDGKCDPNNGLLMNSFIVAPGELILVSDDKGGVTRVSGTSVAAPLVSGAIALLQDRWPWLVNYPQAATQIILQSAKDLGAPGVDPVYGWGELDVAAAQSVLDFDKLNYYQSTNTGLTSLIGIKAIKGQDVLKGGINPAWEASGAYFIVFEPTTGTQRDFSIPLSSRLYGQSINGNLFQQFVYDRMVQWINAAPAKKFGDGDAHLSLSESRVSLPALDGYTVSYGFSDHQVGGLFGTSTSDYTVRFAAEDGSFGLNFGYGEGAAAIGYQSAFGLSSDYGIGGDVNPLLGFASGGSYASADIRLGDGFALSAGITNSGRPLNWDETYGQNADVPFATGNYSANAYSVQLSYQASKSVGLRASYAEVNEGNGLLGVQSLQEDFGSATVTDAFTFASDIALGDGYALGITGTVGHTRSSGNDLAVADPVLSTSYAFALAKTGVFGEHDKARLTLGQPLHVEDGTLSYTQVGVVDRRTGELGLVTQDFAIGGQTRRMDAELIYGTPFADGDGELGGFARMTLADDGTSTRVADYTTGISMRLKF